MHKRRFALAALALLVSPVFGAELPPDAARSRLEAARKAPRKPPVSALEMGLFVPNLPHYNGPGYVQEKATGVGIRLMAEWIPLSGPLGKLTVGAGAAYGKVAETSSTPFVEFFPIEAAIAYRADCYDKQLFVPYVSTGATVTLLHQQFVPGMQRFKGWEYGGGLAVNLYFLEGFMGDMKDRYSHALNTYLAVDLRRVNALGPLEGPDLTRTELRINLRVEY